VTMAGYHVEDDYDNVMDGLCDSFDQHDIHDHGHGHVHGSGQQGHARMWEDDSGLLGHHSHGYMDTQMEMEVLNYEPENGVLSVIDQIERVRLEGVSSALSDVDIVTPFVPRRRCLCPVEVVLDCANIGWFFGCELFDMMGVLLALAYFESLGDLVKVTAFIPASYVRRKPNDGSRGNSLMQTSDWEQVNQLVLSKAISVVPAGENDDKYILSYAWQNNGYIVSNDYFMDHVAAVDNPQEREQMVQWLLDSRCAYTFTRDRLILSPDSKLWMKLHDLSHR
jgi:hypothetical protein